MSAIALPRIPALRLPRPELAGALLVALLATPPCAVAGEQACPLHGSSRATPTTGTAAGATAAAEPAAALAPASATDPGAASDPGTTTGMPADCPMHAAHMAAATTAGERQAETRADAAMGFSQQATVHHFRLSADGGAIEVTAREAGDAGTIAAVRHHLQQIALAFDAGDFSIPAVVHAQEPPGVAAMQAAIAASTLGFRYQELPAGGRVVITARTPEALAGVHEFLRFQITEHGTGDPMTPSAAG